VFLRRQDLIDAFDANFREDEEGQVLFWPRKSEVGLPIDWEQYANLKDTFERDHMRSMALSWVALLSAAGYGLYRLVADDTYIPFFVTAGLAIVFTFSQNAHSALRLLRPLAIRLEELKASTEQAERSS
jgi:hypothetical protein